MFRIIGAELSPYSVKVRSYFRFKGIAHQWLIGGPGRGAYGDRFRIPVVPLVLTPADEALQDSTPIIERLEAETPEDSIHPDDVAIRFISELLEEFGDEWGNKWMFHYRWARDVDQKSAAWRGARLFDANLSEEQQAEIAQTWRERMVPRVWFVGSSEQTAPEIEAGFVRALGQLDLHLADRPYLLGARPCFGDFGVWAQLYAAYTDPTAASLISTQFLNVQAWIQRMLWPRIEGEFESWGALAPTLAPFLADHIGARFLPWSVANMSAVQAGEEEFTVELAGSPWTQKPQKYHAKSLNALRDKYSAVTDKRELDAILESIDCLAVFRP